jgi:hypothetical protein
MIGDYKQKCAERLLVMAIQVLPENIREVLLFCAGQQTEEIDPFDSTNKYVAVNVPTVQGVLRASQYDWVTKTWLGAVGVVNARTFDSDYEKI